ncbi:MAG: DUF4405 domain-containing protein [Tardiphaga sp.]
MSTSDAIMTNQSPAPRETLVARFMQRFATPLTTGLFLVSAVSGIALFFHWQQAAFHSMHEWLSMVLLAPFAFHMWKNWRALVMYAKRGRLILPLAACVIVAVPFAYNSLTSPRGRGGNPAFQATALMTQAPLSDLAPIFHRTPDALIGALRQKGFEVAAPSETLSSVAAAAGKQPFEALAAILPTRQGR